MTYIHLLRGTKDFKNEQSGMQKVKFFLTVGSHSMKTDANMYTSIERIFTTAGKCTAGLTLPPGDSTLASKKYIEVFRRVKLNMLANLPP